jgi:cell division protein FtsZ
VFNLLELVQIVFDTFAQRERDMLATHNSNRESTDQDAKRVPRVKVIGLGKVGCQTVSAASKRGGASYYALDTDDHCLNRSNVSNRLPLGHGITKGLGTSGLSEVGQMAFSQSEGEMRRLIEGTDLLVVVGALGGGTASSAVPALVALANEADVPVKVVVSTPFDAEADSRIASAEEALSKLERLRLDSLIVVPLSNVRGAGGLSYTEAEDRADLVLRESIETITNDALSRPIQHNRDLSAIKAMLSLSIFSR